MYDICANGRICIARPIFLKRLSNSQNHIQGTPVLSKVVNLSHDYRKARVLKKDRMQKSLTPTQLRNPSASIAPQKPAPHHLAAPMYVVPQQPPEQQQPLHHNPDSLVEPHFAPPSAQ